MKKYIFSIFVAVFAVFNISNVNAKEVSIDSLDVAYSKLFGGSSNDSFKDVAIDKNGNIIAVGSTDSNDGDVKKLSDDKSSGNALIVKFDEKFNIIDRKVIGGNGRDEFTSIAISSDNKYIVTGSFLDASVDFSGLQQQGGYDALIMELDSDFNIKEKASLGGSDTDSYNSIVINQNNEYVVAGFSKSKDGDLGAISTTPFGYDGLIVKYDSNMNVISKRLIGGSANEELYKIIVDNNGNYVAVGLSMSTMVGTNVNNGNEDGLLVKLDNNLNLINSKLFGGSKRDVFKSLVQDENNDYVVVGSTESSDNDLASTISKGHIDALIAKFDSNFNAKDVKLYGGKLEDSFSSIENGVGGTYVVGGHSVSSDLDLAGIQANGDFDGMLVYFDNSFNVENQKLFGGSQADKFYSITKDNTGGYYLAGSSKSNNGMVSGSRGNEDALVAKYSSIEYAFDTGLTTLSAYNDDISADNLKKLFKVSATRNGVSELSKVKVIHKINPVIAQKYTIDFIYQTPNKEMKSTVTLDLKLSKNRVVKSNNITYYYSLTNKKYVLIKSVTKKGNTTTTNYYKQIKNKTKLVKKQVHVKKVNTLLNTISYHGNGKVKVNAKYYKSASTNKYTSKNKVIYRSNGKKQKQIKFSYKKGKTAKRIEYVYNKAGQLKSNKYGKAYKYTTTYNKKGKALKTYRKQYSSKGKLAKKNVKVKTRKSF